MTLFLTGPVTPFFKIRSFSFAIVKLLKKNGRLKKNLECVFLSVCLSIVRENERKHLKRERERDYLLRGPAKEP